MTGVSDEDARKWVAQWRSAAVALDKVRTAELRALDDERAVLAFSRVAPSSFIHRPSSGLVIQQKIFSRGR